MNKQHIKDESYGGERPLFASRNLILDNVTILPGESSLKECSGIEAIHCEFTGKYPFWHNEDFLIKDCKTQSHLHISDGGWECSEAQYTPSFLKCNR